MCEDVGEDVSWVAFHSVLHICDDAFDIRGLDPRVGTDVCSKRDLDWGSA